MLRTSTLTEIAGWVPENKALFEKNERLQEIIEALLNRWGRWVFHGNKIDIGYSKKNNIARIIEQGGVLIYGKGFKPIADDPEAQEMERLITKLSHFDPRGAEALKTYYGKQLSRPEAASRLRISMTTFNDRVRLAKTWLAGRVSAEFKI